MVKPAWRLRYIWQTLQEITPLQRRYFLKAVIVHWVSLSAIRTIGFGKYYHRLNQILYHQEPGEWLAANISSHYEIAMIIDKACRYSSRSSTCLSRSITLYWIMQRQKIPVELQIGFRIREDILEGHAWVELDGQVLNDDHEVRDEYTVIENTDNLNNFRQKNYEKLTFN